MTNVEAPKPLNAATVPERAKAAVDHHKRIRHHAAEQVAKFHPEVVPAEVSK